MKKKNKNQIILHLINYCAKKSSGNNIPRMEEINPVNDIEIKLKPGSNNVIKVCQFPEAINLEWVMEKNMLKFKVPKIEIHSLIVVEMGR